MSCFKANIGLVFLLVSSFDSMPYYLKSLFGHFFLFWFFCFVMVWFFVIVVVVVRGGLFA